MKSSPIFTSLEETLIELEHALADFMCDIAPLRESLSFVGLDFNMLNIQSVIAKVSEVTREVRSTIGEQLQSEITTDYTSRRRVRRAAYRLVSDGG
jgi:hypothetical protein